MNPNHLWNSNDTTLSTYGQIHLQSQPNLSAPGYWNIRQIVLSRLLLSALWLYVVLWGISKTEFGVMLLNIRNCFIMLILKTKKLSWLTCLSMQNQINIFFKLKPFRTVKLGFDYQQSCFFLYLHVKLHKTITQLSKT